MRDDKQDQFVDELLEASLKQYRGEESRPGLEMRILAGMRSQQRAARRRGLAWAAAVCAGVLAAIVLTLRFVHTPVRQAARNASLSQPVVTPPAMVSPRQPELRLRESGGLIHGPKKKPRSSKPGVRATKRPEQFPTPLPLTEQEKLLLAYLDEATKTGSVAETSQTGGPPVGALEIPGIKIAALEIKPLDDSQSKQEK